MQRRNFLAGAATAPFLTSGQAQAQPKTPAILELRYFQLRNTLDNQRAKLADWLGKTVAPGIQRTGSGPVGLFSSSIGPDAPFQLLVVQHASLAAWEQCWNKLNLDEEVVKAFQDLNQTVVLPYQRMEVQLLRGFRGFPVIELPPGDAQRPARIFELRTYESNTPTSLRRKIRMFEKGEIDLFMQHNLLPVFFGETISGPRMPNLTYMVAFDNLAAREANWRSFATSPEWKKMSGAVGVSDGEVVSNISNTILSPMAGSMIR
jgi:hypothetical protein